MRFRISLALFTALGVASAWLGWMVYESRPGQAAQPPAHYPEAGPLPRLMMFLHPRCPCSRASLEAFRPFQSSRAHLEIIISGPVQLAQPEYICGLRAAFDRCEVSLDSDGRRRELYRVWTSGQVVGYDERGDLGFCGGLTSGRGQTGPSSEQDRLKAWLLGERVTDSPVFGCPLVSPDECCCQSQATGRRNQ
jgi:hypothetical protein